MYFIKEADFEKLEKALSLLPSGEQFKELSKEDQDIIVNAEVVMVQLIKDKKKKNSKIAKYVAEKRKVNKNYAR